MNVLNKEDIRKFLKRFSGRDENVSDCLYLALSGPLQREPSCLKEIQDAQELASPILRKKFNRRAAPWFHFLPNEGVDDKCKTVCIWLMNFLESADNDLSGELKRQAKEKLRAIRTLDQAMMLIRSGPLMTSDEISAARSARLIPDEERRGHFHHEAAFHGGLNLYKITTTTGMTVAGEKASNCLKKADAPDKLMPHRKRVRFPDNWQYFIVLDVDNNVVATFMTDYRQKSIEYEGNAGKNIRGNSEQIIGQFVNYMNGAKNEFMKNNPHIGYYGNFFSSNAPTLHR